MLDLEGSSRSGGSNKLVGLDWPLRPRWRKRSAKSQKWQSRWPRKHWQLRRPGPVRRWKARLGVGRSPGSGGKTHLRSGHDPARRWRRRRHARPSWLSSHAFLVSRTCEGAFRRQRLHFGQDLEGGALAREGTAHRTPRSPSCYDEEESAQGAQDAGRPCLSTVRLAREAGAPNVPPRASYHVAPLVASGVRTWLGGGRPGMPLLHRGARRRPPLGGERRGAPLPHRGTRRRPLPGGERLGARLGPAQG